MFARLRFGLLPFGLLLAVGCGEPASEGGEGGEPGSGGARDGSGGSSPEGGAPAVGGSLPVVACEKDAECDDGDACTGTEACGKGHCQYGEPVNCNDNVACTRDSCDPDDGKCSNVAPDKDNDGYRDATCRDDDGVPLGDDCDDGDAERSPGNVEVCSVTFQGSSSEGIGDGKDEDCDPKTVGERDVDGDRFVDKACFNVEPHSSKVNRGEDCSDTLRSVNPNVPEVCDGFDNNCNGLVDEGLTITRYEDPDGDGYGGVIDPQDPDEVILTEVEVCPGAPRLAEQETDCAPEDPYTAPGRVELCDGVDNDCDKEVDENVFPATWYKDADHDGYGDPSGGTRATCQRIDGQGWSLYPGDCDDHDAAVNPGQEEVCDGKNNDCSPDTTFWIGPGNGEDDDNDGFADAHCGGAAVDCNDELKSVHPGAPELCDGIDNDCNGVVDTRTADVDWYTDRDNDGFGDEFGEVVTSCEEQRGLVLQGGDCADDNEFIHPGSQDDCFGLHGEDDDCDGGTDEGEALNSFYLDADGDGYGAGETPVGLACAVPANYVGRGGDCADDKTSLNPGMAELCDPASTEDRNCNGLVGCADPTCASVAACEALSGLSMDPSSPTTAFVSATFSATVVLKDSASIPVPNAAVTVVGPAGSLFPAAAVTTDSQGRANLALGVGMKEGPYAFTIRAGGTGATKPILYTVSATLPPDGTVWSIVNRPAVGAAGTLVPSTFGPNGRLYYPADIAVDLDGSAYIASYSRIAKLDPLGQLSIISGSASGNGGDGGPASAATLSGPQSIVLDKVNHWLYVASAERVRVIDLSKAVPTIHLVAGGGATAPPGPGAAVTLGGTVNDLAVGPDGRLAISATNGFYYYDPKSGLVTPSRVLKDVTTSGPIAAAGGYHHFSWSERGLLLTGYFRGSYFGGSQAPGAALVESGEALRFVYGSGSGGSLTNGSLRHTTSVPAGAGRSRARFDAAGNVLFSSTAQGDSADAVWSVDSLTGRISRVYGTGATGFGSEYVDRAVALTTGSVSFDIGPEGDLWVAEYADPSRIRRVRNGGKGSSSSAKLTIESAEGLSYWPGQPLQPTEALVTDDGDAPLSDMLVEQTSGAFAQIGNIAITNLAGRALNSGLAEVSTTPTDKLLNVSLRRLDGSIAATDTLGYQVVTPPAGSVTSWINNNPTNYDQDTTDAPLADGTSALTARGHYLSGPMTTDGAGNTYWVDASYNNGPSYAARVYKVSPNGLTTLVAGNTSAGNTGDGGDARAAGIIGPLVALHEPSGRLFIASGISVGGPRVMRVVNLATGVIEPFGGYGAAAAPGASFLDTAPISFGKLAVVGDNLFLMADDFIYRVNLAASLPVVEAFLTRQPATPASPTPVFYGCFSSSTLCSLAPAPGGKYFLAAIVSGAGSGASTYASITLCASNGTPEKLIAGGSASLAMASGSPVAIVSDAIGRIFGVDYAAHVVFRIDPPPEGSSVYKFSTLAGYSGTSGFVDFVSGASARFKTPRNLAALPDGSLLVEDAGNHVVRRLWGVMK